MATGDIFAQLSGARSKNKKQGYPTITGDVVYTKAGVPLTPEYLQGRVEYNPDWKFDASGNPTSGGFSVIGADAGSPWLGAGGYLDTGANITNALSGLAGAYTGWKALKLGEEQFDWQKAAANRDLENQGLAYNTALMDRAAIGARLGGKNEADTAAILAAAEKNKMNTRPI